MAHALNTAFSPFQGASADVLAYYESVAPEDAYLASPKGNALEVRLISLSSRSASSCYQQLAIIGNAKRFISSPPVQRVIDAIWTGEIIYSPQSFIDLLPDHYRRKPITIYDAASAPIFDHSRLVVPRTRLLLEFMHFIVLFLSYLAVVLSKSASCRNEIWLRSFVLSSDEARPDEWLGNLAIHLFHRLCSGQVCKCTG